MYTFPGTAKESDREIRDMWLKAINRADPKKPHTWLRPTKNMVVCSRHFVDGEPSQEHPCPELYLHSNTVARQLSTSDSASAQNRKRWLEDRDKGKEESITAGYMPVCDEAEEIVNTSSSQPTSFIIIALKFIIYVLLSLIRRQKKEKEEVEEEKSSMEKKLRAKNKIQISAYFQQ